ncbi:MAG TPA: DUF1761 domain-containing protein [Euzebyales bacterium]|nr:DUF1761 domain-containing protein [Euzebyales bacterium]
MTTVNPWAVVAAVVVAFVASAVLYGALGRRLAELSPAYAGDGRSPLATLGVELARNTVLALVVAVLVARLGVTSAGGALGLALLLWVGVPVVVLTGSVFHERVPALLAAIHAGDWLVKLALVTLIIACWR